MTTKQHRFRIWLARVAAWVRQLRGHTAESHIKDKPAEAPPAAPQPAAPPVTRKTKKPKPKAVPKATPPPQAPACPHCKKPMVVKVARTGGNAGGNFWGCGVTRSVGGFGRCWRRWGNSLATGETIFRPHTKVPTVLTQTQSVFPPPFDINNPLRQDATIHS